MQCVYIHIYVFFGIHGTTQSVKDIFQSQRGAHPKVQRVKSPVSGRWPIETPVM